MATQNLTQAILLLKNDERERIVPRSLYQDERAQFKELGQKIESVLVPASPQNERRYERR